MHQYGYGIGYGDTTFLKNLCRPIWISGTNIGNGYVYVVQNEVSVHSRE
jgi:hypothetical protein